MCAQHAISYTISNNIDDTILSYAQARYLSHITSLPFLYREFKGSDAFDIKYNASSYDEKMRYYWKRFIINSSQSLTEFLGQIRDCNVGDTLYIVDYVPGEISVWLSPGIKHNLSFSIPWNDFQFSPVIDQLFSHARETPDLTKKGRLNIAVWVGKLSEDALQNDPLVNPNRAYYRNQILRVYELSINCPLYVCLLSADAQVASLYEDLKIQFKDYDIEIIISDLDNSIQNFFAMQKFDVLIATQSNLPMIALKRNLFDMAIYPVHYQKNNNNYWVDYVEVVTKKSEWFPYALTAGYRDYLN